MVAAIPLAIPPPLISLLSPLPTDEGLDLASAVSTAPATRVDRGCSHWAPLDLPARASSRGRLSSPRVREPLNRRRASVDLGDVHHCGRPPAR